MSATALLLLIVAIFIILNAGNFTQVLTGKAQVSFLGKGKRSNIRPDINTQGK